MRARLSEGYRPEFDIDLRRGKAGEQLVANFVKGFLDGTIEVKADAKYLDTQRIYIEYECRRRDGWQPSGIATTKADYWALVLGEAVVIGIPTPIVVRCYEKALAADARYGHRVEEKDGSHPTRCVAIPLDLFLTWVFIELRKRAQAA